MKPHAQSPAGRTTLSVADAVELAAQLSQSARSGLPLPAALRLSAQHLPKAPLRQVLLDLAASLEAGVPLDGALEELALRLPPHLGQLLIAGARTGRLPETLDEILAHQRTLDDVTARFWHVTLYPAVVLAFFLAWLLFMALWLIPTLDLTSLGSEYGDVPLKQTGEPLAEFAAIAPTLILGTLMLGLLAVGLSWLIGGTVAWSRLLEQVPLVGPVWAYRGQIEFCSLLEIFLRQQWPLPAALRSAAGAARDPAIAATCRLAAADVEHGVPLADSLERQRAVPDTLNYLVRWGQQHSALVESLSAARQIYADRLELQIQWVRLVFPPAVFFLIAGSVSFIYISFLTPLVGFIVALSSWIFTPPPPASWSDFVYLVRPSGLVSVLVCGTLLWATARAIKVLGIEAEATRRLLRYAGLVVTAVGLLGFCVLVAHLWGLLAYAVMLVFWLRGAMRFTAMQKRNLFATLAVAMEKQMPLAPLVMAFAHEQEGAFADRAYRLARRLEAGLQMGEAIEHSRGALPREAVLAAHLAAGSGDLAEAFRATTYSRVFDRGLMRPIIVRWFYVFPIMLAFLIFMKIKIEPSFIKIFRDFDSPLPPISDLVMGRGGDRAIELLVVLMSATFLIGILAWLEWRGTLWPRLPGLRRAINWVDMGPALRVLGMSAREQLPLAGVLRIVAAYHPKSSLRGRMSRVAQAASAGQPWQESMRRQRLLSRADAAVLTAAERSGNLDWALLGMADSFERRANFRLQAVSQVALPVLLLPAALGIMLLAVGYFAPLTTLIRMMSW